MKVGVLRRDKWRNTGIEGFESRMVPSLLEEEKFHPIDFHISESYPISATMSRLLLGRKVRKEVEEKDLNAVLVPSQDLMLGINPEKIDAEIVPYIHDILTVTTSFTSKFVKLLDKKVAKNIEKCDFAMTASENTQRELIERTGFTGNAESVYQDVDVEKIDENRSYSDRDIDLIYIGTLIERKNPETVRKVAELCERKNLRMVAVNYQELDLPCETYTDISNDELKELLDNSQYYLHPSFQEGFGRGAVEAQRRGVPVIARENQVNQEILQNFLAANSAEKIVEKLENSENWQDMSEKSIKNSERFNWKYARENITRVLKAAAQ